MQPQSWIEPHLIQKVIQPRSKTGFETIQPQLEYNPTHANFGIIEVVKWRPWNETMYEQCLESGFIWNHKKIIFMNSFDFKGT